MGRKICIVTGTRAEYGLLYWLMKAIEGDEELELQTVVTGMHLSPEFGSTWQTIEADGFFINAKVEMLLSSETSVGITKSIGLGVISFAETFDRLKPDILVILGDRFEILAAAQAAMVAKIPIAHLHGGESSEGAFDEVIRHALTKMSHWHFVASEPYRKRVIQLGEFPEQVFNYGAPGLDHLQNLNFLSRANLADILNTSLASPLFLVTYHPVTLDEKPPSLAMSELLSALDQFPDANVIFTYPNADTGGRTLIQLINEWVDCNSFRARAFPSLGQLRYLSLMNVCDVVIGNSSSGLLEAPSLKKATVNIGDRQKGRLKATSVIDSTEEKQAIIQAILKALSYDFRSTLEMTQSPYGSGQVSQKIKDRLKVVPLTVQKAFFNIEHGF